ncbi:MAG: hypothetical protein V1790_16165 [Planctomycetota bacterium]
MKQQKGPRRLGGRVAGDYRIHPHSTVESADGKSSLEDLGVLFAGEALEAEAVAAVAGWLNPALFNDAAADAGLTAEHFDEPFRRLLFWYACACAELNRWPDVREACELGQSVGVPVNRSDLFSILIPPLSFIEAGRLNEYVQRVIDFARRRGESRDPSLLPKLDGKVLVVKDFTAVLTMPNEARSEVLGTLRDAYDGEAGKAFGTGEVKRYKSRFGLLAAATPVIESYWGVAAQLGERFLRFRIRSRGRRAKVKRALANTNDETAMRRELSNAALGVLAQTPYPPTIPDDIADRLIHLADFVSRARSGVSRNRQGVVEHIPAPEVGTRVGKALKKLAMGIAMARGVKGVDEEIYRIVRRVALDCVPSMRGRLLRVLWDCRGAHELTSTIADRAELGTDTAKVWLDDLRLLGIVDRDCAGASVQAGYRWRLTGELQQTITLCGVLDDNGTDGPDRGSDPLDGGVGGVPPDSAPQTAGVDGGASERSGVQSHPPAPSHVTDSILDPCFEMDGLVGSGGDGYSEDRSTEDDDDSDRLRWARV